VRTSSRRLTKAIVTISAFSTVLSGFAVGIHPAVALAEVPLAASPVIEERAALSRAQATGSPVTVESKITPNSLTEALPDGSLRLTSSTLPVRALVDDKWEKIDTSLHATDRGIEPSVALNPTIFSAGGDSTLMKIQTPTKKWISESWGYGTLPVPTVKDSFATYRDVFDGVDLRLEATASGLSEVLVVKTADAAKNPELQQVRLGLSGGRFNENAAREVVSSSSGALVASAPFWWDSSNSDASIEGPGGETLPQPLGQNVTADAVALDVASVVAKSDLHYPIYIDPDWNAGAQASWFTDRAFPSVSYLNGAPAGYLSVGAATQSGVSYLSRGYWQFGVSDLIGKQIRTAQFAVRQTSAVANSGTQIQLWRYGPATPGFSWNSDPGAWASPLGSYSLPQGSNAANPAAWVGMDATAGVAAVTGAGQGTLQLGLRAANEGDQTSRKHYDFGGQLTVTYNSIPRVPTDPSFSSPFRSCQTTKTAPSYVNNASQALVMQVQTSDPDAGSNVTGQFEVVDGNSLAPVLHYSSPTQAQGWSSAAIPKSTLAPGLYAWHVTLSDGLANSAYSQYCYFQVQNSGPGLPTVTEVTATTPTTVISPATGVVGKPISVKVTPSAIGKTAVYGYWWTPGPALSPSPASPVPAFRDWDTGGIRCPVRSGAVWFACADASGSATITAAPIDGPQATLWVAGFDGAGNISTNIANVNDGSTATGLQVATASDPSIQYNNVAGGELWSVDNFVNPLPATGKPGIPNANPAHSAQAMTLTNADIVTPTPQGSPLYDDNVLSFGGLVELATWNYSSGNYVTSASWQAPDGHTWTPQVSQGYMSPYPVLQAGASASTPAGKTTLYNCTLSATQIFNSTSATCEGKGATGKPLGFIWATKPGTGRTTKALYRCGDSGYDVHTASACTGPVGAIFLGFIDTIVEQATAPDAYELTDDDTKHGFTYSAWVNSNPSGLKYDTGTDEQEAAGTSGQVAMAYSGVFYLFKAAGHWKLCWPDWGPPAYEPCVDGPAINDNTWTFVSVEWDPGNSQLKLILNGQVSTATVASRQTQSVMWPTYNHILTLGATDADTGDEMGDTHWMGYLASISGFPGVANSIQLSNLMSESAP